jgi:UDP-glucose 4-epimerase
MVVPTMVRQALEERPITVFGDGSQSRCFTHVRDVVGALVALADHPYAVGEIFNVGNDEETTILELAKRIKQRTGSSSEITHVAYEQAYEDGFEDMMRRVPDLTKVHEMIGYEPSVDLDGILDSVIAEAWRRISRRAIPSMPFHLQA